MNGECDAAMSVDPYHGFSGKERGEDRFLHRLNRGLKDIVDRGVGVVEPLFAEKQSVWVIGNPVRSTEGNGELSAPILASSTSAGDAEGRPLGDSHQLTMRQRNVRSNDNHDGALILLARFPLVVS